MKRAKEKVRKLQEEVNFFQRKEQRNTFKKTGKEVQCNTCTLNT